MLIGVFDGVHRGHQALLAQARGVVGSGGRVIAVTFNPHPAAVLVPGREPLLLLPLDERVALLGEHGADEVLITNFTSELALWSPEQFVDEVLMPTQPTDICVGENFRFGHRASGDCQTLADLGESRGFVVHVVPLAADAHMAWSSTRIRSLVLAGDMAAAAEILGRPHRLVGPVVHGDARGRQLGFPTANIKVADSYAIPADGVYAGFLTTTGQKFRAAISIGTNPQFAGYERRVEVFAMDAPQEFDIYDCMTTVEFTSRVRGQEVFATLDEFIAQMHRDISHIRGLT